MNDKIALYCLFVKCMILRALAEVLVGLGRIVVDATHEAGERHDELMDRIEAKGT